MRSSASLAILSNSPNSALGATWRSAEPPAAEDLPAPAAPRLYNLGIRYGVAPPSHIPSERIRSRQKSAPFSIRARAFGLTAARSPGLGGLQGLGAPKAR